MTYLLAGAAAAGQELPLHLGGEGEAAGTARQVIEIGVAVGGGHLVAEGRGEVAEPEHGVRVGGPRGQPYGQDAEAVAAHGDGQVHQVAGRLAGGLRPPDSG